MRNEVIDKIKKGLKLEHYNGSSKTPFVERNTMIDFLLSIKDLPKELRDLLKKEPKNKVTSSRRCYFYLYLSLYHFIQDLTVNDRRGARGKIGNLMLEYYNCSKFAPNFIEIFLKKHDLNLIYPDE